MLDFKPQAQKKVFVAFASFPPESQRTEDFKARMVYVNVGVWMYLYKVYKVGGINTLTLTKGTNSVYFKQHSRKQGGALRGQRAT